MPRSKKTAEPVILPTMPLPTFHSVAQIEVAPENPRHDIGEDELNALAESIAAAGLLMPLIGYDDPNYSKAHITVGGRRTRALKLLLSQGRWPSAELNVPVILLPKDRAIEAGVNEQLSHVALSEADTIHAFTLPYYAALSDAECARQMGLTLREVKKRRRVLELPEEILDALWAKQITADQAIGLTYWIEAPEVLGDFFAQACEDPGLTAADMRGEFAENAPLWHECKFAAFTTEEAYVAAGGRLQPDLFVGGSYVLDLDILVNLAEAAIVAELQAKYPRRSIRFLESGYPAGYHPGIPRLTEEEMDELIALGMDKTRREANPERYADLQSRRGNHYPPELEQLLDINLLWAPGHGEKAYHLYDHVLPPKEEREALYEAGWMKRPADPDREANKAIIQQVTTNRNGIREDTSIDATKADVLPSTLTLAMEKIVTHAHRQILIQDPHKASLVYLHHLASLGSRRYGDAAYWFHTKVDPTETDFTDLAVTFHKDWLKAATHQDDKVEEIEAYKPSDARLVMAWRLLSCMTLGYGRKHPLPAEAIRRFWSPDEKFLARYKSAQLEQMLGGERMKALLQRIAGKPNKNALIQEVAKLARSNPTWLPTGFEAFLPKAAAPEPAPAPEPVPTDPPREDGSTPEQDEEDAVRMSGDPDAGTGDPVYDPRSDSFFCCDEEMGSNQDGSLTCDVCGGEISEDEAQFLIAGEHPVSSSETVGGAPSSEGQQTQPMAAE